jgi:hypothetical protein
MEDGVAAGSLYLTNNYDDGSETTSCQVIVVVVDATAAVVGRPAAPR